MSNWVPPWHTRAQATGALILIWTVPALLRLDLSLTSTADLHWLREWLQQYLARQPEGSSEETDYSFFYVLVGDLSGVDPNGRVDGKAILEAGFGGPPVGPDDAGETSVNELVRFVIDSLPT